MRDSLINHGLMDHVVLEADYTQLSPLSANLTPVASQLGHHPSTISHIRLTLVDKDGLIQQMQPKKFRVETEGLIRLLGVETGDKRRMDSWRTTELSTYFGEGLIRVQSTEQTGTARLLVYVEGFDNPFVQTIQIRQGPQCLERGTG